MDSLMGSEQDDFGHDWDQITRSSQEDSEELKLPSSQQTRKETGRHRTVTRKHRLFLSPLLGMELQPRWMMVKTSMMPSGS